MAQSRGFPVKRPAGFHWVSLVYLFSAVGDFSLTLTCVHCGASGLLLTRLHHFRCGNFRTSRSQRTRPSSSRSHRVSLCYQDGTSFDSAQCWRLLRGKCSRSEGERRKGRRNESRSNTARRTAYQSLCDGIADYGLYVSTFARRFVRFSQFVL
jgi:hypothetical protein